MRGLEPGRESNPRRPDRAGRGQSRGGSGNKAFKSWYAVRDNLRSCVGFGFAPEDQPDGAFLRTARDLCPRL